MKNLLYTLCLFVLASSCNEGSENKTQADQSVLTALKPYFDYDGVVHYKIDLESRQAHQLINKVNKSKQDTLLLNAVLSVWHPKTINDTNFISALETLPFQKRILPVTMFPVITDIFKEKKAEESIPVSTCSPIFRDILIFSKSDTVIGLAKICFECQLNYITGTKANTFMFGQHGDYKKLEALLSN